MAMFMVCSFVCPLLKQGLICDKVSAYYQLCHLKVVTLKFKEAKNTLLKGGGAN